MSSVNKAILLGNLGRDPEARQTQSGNSVVTLNIATSENWKDKQSGDRREHTEWHKVVIFSQGLCKVASDYLQKGSKVYIEGQLATRKWTDKQGIERYSTEIVLKGYSAVLKLLGGSGGKGGQDSDRGGADGAYSASDQGYDDLDDDIPF